MKHIVGLSGGIDSQAAARWVLNRNHPDDVILMNSDAGGNEDVLTTAHIGWYSLRFWPGC
jgi:7-cyano-7-deazaguanine synthase in queuosine biosynthesis